MLLYILKFVRQLLDSIRPQNDIVRRMNLRINDTHKSTAYNSLLLDRHYLSLITNFWSYLPRMPDVWFFRVLFLFVVHR